MASSNFRVSSGNGILSGVLLDPDFDRDDSGATQTAASPFKAQSQLGASLMGHTASNVAPPPFGGTSRWMMPWPPATLNAADRGVTGVALAGGGPSTISPNVRAAQSAFLNNNRFALSPSGPPFSDLTSGGSQPAAPQIPVGYGDSTRPWWVPAPGPFGDWQKRYNEGMNGLYKYLRDLGSRAGTSSGDDDFCYARWKKEDARCGQFYPFGVRYYHACKTRASDRRALCIKNGGRPNPDEPDEYDYKDIPPDFPRQ